MKKEYNTPVIEVVSLDEEDIVTTSPPYYSEELPFDPFWEE